MYYLFIGLHAAYDESKALATEAAARKVEDRQGAPPTNGK
jgi:hypothetical protein